jgi:hypothetical protein
VLKWTRVESGQYHAYGETHSYYVECHKDNWRIRIFKDLKPVALNYYGDNKKENVMLANAFENLGDGYRPEDHEHRERITEAVAITHKAIMAELMGDVDTEAANPVASTPTEGNGMDDNDIERITGETPETRAVMRALGTETDMHVQAGERFQMGSVEEYAKGARKWLGDQTELTGKEIDNADYSVALEWFRETVGWVDPNATNPLKSESQASGKGHKVSESKLFSAANRQAVHHKDDAEKCNTVKRAAAREYNGFPILSLEEAGDIKPCANCVTEVEAELIIMAEALEAPTDTTPDPEVEAPQEDAPEAVEDRDAPDGGHAEYSASMEANKPEDEAPEEDDDDTEEEEAPEARASREFGVADPWKAWENWGAIAKASKNRPGGENAYQYWDDRVTRIGEILGAE